jgi:hypothetical protein
MSDRIPDPLPDRDTERDPDLETVDSALGAGPDADADLTTETLLPEKDGDGSDPPDAPSPALATGVTAADEAGQETIDQRLQQEEPEPDPYAAGARDAEHDVLET